MIGEFWGKARPDDRVSAHPLLAHSLDVAAVAILLARGRHLGIDRRMLGFLVSLHDIGKYSRPFQAKARECWPVEALGPYPTTSPPPGPAHDVVGLHFLADVHADRLKGLLPAGEGSERGWKASDRTHLWRALTGHHGRPPSETSRISLNVVCPACRDAAGQFLDTMHMIFQPPAWKRPARERDVVRICWGLAGLTTLSDWIGSRQAWFPYVARAAIADPAV
jgi:CRISPR-associated endonuclease/helicase Cas3